MACQTFYYFFFYMLVAYNEKALDAVAQKPRKDCLGPFYSFLLPNGRVLHGKNKRWEEEASNGGAIDVRLGDDNLLFKVDAIRCFKASFTHTVQ